MNMRASQQRSDGLVPWTLAERPDLKKAYSAIEQEAWSSLLYLNYSASFHADYFALLQEYADHQVGLVDATGYPIAIGNTVPVPFVPPESLPEDGWDWVVNQARAHGATPPPEGSMLGALAISVPSVHRGRGVARRMIEEFAELARRRGYRCVVVPARPSAKAQHPWVPMEEYVRWTDNRGRIYDPWLRSHAAAGGRIIGTCNRSMVVDEPIPFWEVWAKQRFERSGDYLLPGCLVPVRIDFETGRGVYAEPGVWVVYDL